MAITIVIVVMMLMLVAITIVVVVMVFVLMAITIVVVVMVFVLMAITIVVVVMVFVLMAITIVVVVMMFVRMATTIMIMVMVFAAVMMTAFGTNFFVFEVVQFFFKSGSFFHSFKKLGTVYVVPGGCYYNAVFVVLTNEFHGILDFVLGCTLCVAEDNSPCVRNLVVVELTKILHVHFALVYIGYCCKGI